MEILDEILGYCDSQAENNVLNLIKKLKDNNVKFNPLTDEEIYNILKEKNIDLKI